MGLFTPKWMKRAEKTAKLKDQQKLFKAAMESEYQGVIREAASRLTDDNLLFRFITEREDCGIEIKELAIDRVSDQELLLKIFEHYYYHVKRDERSSLNYRYRALHRIYDPKVLKHYLAKSAKERGINDLKKPAEDYAEDMLKLASEIPADPEGQRAYINSLESPTKIRCCCNLIETLRPYAADIEIVIRKERLYFDSTAPGMITETLFGHEAACEKWKKSAEKLIALSAEQPQILYPVWDILEEAINGAEATVRSRKKIGVKYIGDMYEPTKINDYEYSEKRTSLGLSFPANK